MRVAYDPGALEAALAAAVGDEPGLIAELRRAFFESAHQHLISLRTATSAVERAAAAQRMKSLAASFGAIRLMDAASAALSGDVDERALARVERAVAAINN